MYSYQRFSVGPECLSIGWEALYSIISHPKSGISVLWSLVKFASLPACSWLPPRDVDTQPLHAAMPKARDCGSHSQGSHPITVQGTNDFASRTTSSSFAIHSRLVVCFRPRDCGNFRMEHDSLACWWVLRKRVHVVGDDSDIMTTLALVDTRYS